MSWNKRSMGAAPPGLPPYAQQSYNQPAAGGGAWQTASAAPPYGHSGAGGTQFPPPAPQYYAAPPNNNSHADGWEEQWDWGWDGQPPAPHPPTGPPQHAPHSQQQQYAPQPQYPQQYAQQPQTHLPPQHQAQHHQSHQNQIQQNQYQQNQMQQNQLHQNHLQQNQHQQNQFQQNQPQQNQLQQHQPQEHHNVYNNANIIEDSFAANDTWNWNMGGPTTDHLTSEVGPPPQGASAPFTDSKAIDNQAPTPVADPNPVPYLNSAPAPDITPASDHLSAPEVPQAPERGSVSAPGLDQGLEPDTDTGPPSEAPRLTDDVPEPGLVTEPESSQASEAGRPTLALGKRFHPDTLTPQWSIESQMSQDSSDGPLTQSEGTYRSDELSRHSNKSSPGLSVEANFNYAQPEFDDFSAHEPRPARPGDSEAPPAPRTAADLSAALRDLSIEHEAPAPPAAPARDPDPPRASPPPPLAPPPTAMPPVQPGSNPFKQAGPFSHRAAAKPGGFPSGARPVVPYGANLETAPDNSERPDGPAPSLPRPTPPPAEEPDNLEVAPSAERAQYLQAAPAGEYGGPPPGLRRMVPGRGAGVEPPGPPRRVPDGRPAPLPIAREPQAEGENLQDLPPPAPVAAPAATPRRERDSDGRYSRGSREADGQLGRTERDAGGGYARDERDADGHYARDEREVEARYGRGARDADGHVSRGSREDARRGPREERAERRRERDERDERADSPGRRARRPPRSRRYDTEDTDYASDRDRDRRRGREGSAWEGAERPRRRRDDERRRRHYRDIDPARHRAPRDHDARRRTVVTFAPEAAASAEEYSPSRAATDEDGGGGGGAGGGGARRERRSRRHDPRHDPRLDPRLDPRHHSYVPDYASFGGAGAGVAGGVLTREQYEYFARLRVADPHAYLQLYRRLAEPYGGLSYDARTEDRASVHSGRSSANGLKGNDTFGGYGRAGSLSRGAHSCADSDRELTTDVSLALAEGSGRSARSDRFTPLHFAAPHAKGVISGVQLALSGAGGVALLPLKDLLPPVDPASHPPPPEHGVTHKKSVLDYIARQSACVRRGRAGGDDPAGQALTWDYLALLLRQNGVVVGSDVAELLIKNVQEFEYESAPAADGSRRGSSAAREAPPDDAPDAAIPQAAICIPGAEGAAGVRLRELLLYGNRSEALECAMDNKLWGHALALAIDASGLGAAGALGAVAARFVRSLPPRDCARTLHCARLPRRHRLPSSWDESCGDWRPHAAVLLANAADDAGAGGGAAGGAAGAGSAHEASALRRMADALAARGWHSSAQLCYLWGGEAFAAAPGAPWLPQPVPRARLWLLLGSPGAVDAATVRSAAVRATAIYEYASRRTIPSLQVYKAVMALRMLDLGLPERALAWARGVRGAVPPACARALLLTHRFLPAEENLEGAGEWEGVEGSPSRRWLQQLQQYAEQPQAEYGAALESPAPAAAPPAYPAPLAPLAPPAAGNNYFNPVEPVQSQTAEQAQLYNPDPLPATQSYQPREEYIAPQYPPTGNETSQFQPSAGDADSYQPNSELTGYPHTTVDDTRDYNDWAAAQYNDNYWTGENSYGGYGEGAGAARPTITMPGRSSLPDEPDRAAQQQQSDKLSEAAPAPTGGTGGAGGKEPGKADGKKAGWLGGILTKLSLRPPNQMILPDDKNPSIVWDESRKCWRDVDGGATDPAPPPPPPAGPPAARMPPPLGTSSPLASPALAAAAPAANIFKMQKSRHIKNSYVDVLAGPRAGAPPAAPAPPPPAPAYFVPPPTDPALSTTGGGDDRLLYHAGI